MCCEHSVLCGGLAFCVTRDQSVSSCRKSFVFVTYDYKRDRIPYINLDFNRSSVALIESEIVKVLSNSVTCSVLLAVVMDGEEYWCI